jgi:hypothetical protein
LGEGLGTEEATVVLQERRVGLRTCKDDHFTALRLRRWYSQLGVGLVPTQKGLVLQEQECELLRWNDNRAPLRLRRCLFKLEGRVVVRQEALVLQSQEKGVRERV